MTWENKEHIRPLGRQVEQDVFEKWARIAERNTAFATHVLDWCEMEPVPNKWMQVYKGIHSSMLRHLVEMLDAIPNLLLNRQITVAKLALRALLETTITLLYILAENTDARTEAFIYMEEIAHQERLEKRVKDSSAYSSLIELYTKDLLLWSHPPTSNDPKWFQDQKLNVQEVLSTMPHHPDKEIERLKSLPKKDRPSRRIEWYMLFGNARSIRGMAENVYLGGTYDLFYNRYSGKTHGVDLTKDALEHDQQSNNLKHTPIRYVKHGSENKVAKEIVGLSTSLAGLAFARYTDCFLPNRFSDVTNWWNEYLEAVKNIDASVI